MPFLNNPKGKESKRRIEMFEGVSFEELARLLCRPLGLSGNLQVAMISKMKLWNTLIWNFFHCESFICLPFDAAEVDTIPLWFHHEFPIGPMKKKFCRLQVDCCPWLNLCRRSVVHSVCRVHSFPNSPSKWNSAYMHHRCEALQLHIFMSNGMRYGFFHGTLMLSAFWIAVETIRRREDIGAGHLLQKAILQRTRQHS